MKRDNKTIGITVRFFTNGLPEKVGTENNRLTPMWSNGFVYSEANQTKGIKVNNVAFRGLNDLPRAIEALMAKNKVALVIESKIKKQNEKRS